VEKLTKKKQQTLAALKTLEEAIHKLSQLKKDDFFYPEVRDSVIKRFEYSIDTFWKFLRIYLEEKHGVIPPVSPKGVFKVALDTQVISDQEEDELRLLIENRNLTSHAYNIELAESISSLVPLHYQVMSSIANRLS
jgi:nucleotidyltransferase substrate binding protein (TIGR01987 family)